MNPTADLTELPAAAVAEDSPTSAAHQTLDQPTQADQAQAAQAATRDRLLEAAGQVFAEKGFRRATIREICDRAGKANIAAVNYHFGDKMRLYTAVLDSGLKAALDRFPPDMGLPESPTPEQRLHAYVRSYLFRLLGQGSPAWHGRLMAQEMIEPTEAIDALLATTIRPLAQRLESIIRDLLPADAPEDTVRACSCSIAGQCCFYRHAEAMLSRLYPQHRVDADDIARLAEHVTRFSLEGLRGYRDGPGRTEPVTAESFALPGRLPALPDAMRSPAALAAGMAGARVAAGAATAGTAARAEGTIAGA